MKSVLGIAVAVGMLTTMSFAQARDSVRLPLNLAGGLISGGGVGNPTGTGRVEISVKRWSSDDERRKLVAVLADKGQDALLDALSRATSVGTVRFNTQLAWDLRYARQMPLDEGGTRVFLATDRPMSAWEIWNDPRYSMYPFTLIDLQFDREGKATGSLMLAARVTADADGRFVNVENFATQPIAITQIDVRH